MLVRENEELDRMQLPRINDDYEFIRYELSQDLVPVSETDALKIAADLPTIAVTAVPGLATFFRTSAPPSTTSSTRRCR